MPLPRKRPRQQRSKETYDAILEAAAQLFERDGYARATTNRIAERAGVSIGSLYQYFPDKDALLYALGERHMLGLTSRLLVTLSELRSTNPPLPQTVSAVVRAVADAHTAEPGLQRLLYDRAPRPRESAARLREVQQWIAAEVEHHLHRLAVGGPNRGLTALLLVQSIEAQLHGALLDPPEGCTAAQVVETVESLCLRALARP
ncbi:TetR/AcrR family transcriptional regulator [Streptomyces sp. HD]|uniref:TetR/AcrR family transcriptional regulator n=1 Tax=Streptomyces sp. HD TaxID=3020892 RepID=UPI00232E9312|nr:TetR/AcrR family transcriptional regulator [Streptomyces sp. HD]MDC0769520.1 TetR/AcrR family transcriptional regulator [Streptomyces sp. HD]